MKKMYSHSRLSTFEQCPLKFKYRYIDKIIPEVEKSIETHLGSSVHLTLEWLYTQVKGGKVPTVDELVFFYSDSWEKDFSPKFVIVKKGLTAKDYFNMGLNFLLGYYTENKPFNDNTLEVEKRVLVDLGEEDYVVQGFIDRLAYNLQTKEYEIHDYKTSGNPPEHGNQENDRQLALYSIAIKQTHGNDKPVILIWHYLAYNKRVKIRKTDEELEKLKKETLELIKKIESQIDFPPKKSRLCEWCEYKSICPAWENKREVQRKL